MSIQALHQFVHSFVDHDAISSHARHLQRVIRSLGLGSEVYAGEWRGENSRARYFREFSEPEAGILYHLSTASPMAQFLEQQSNPLFVNYHNITPFELLAPWEPGVAPELNVARGQLAQLAPRTTAAVGASGYNQAELDSVGYVNTTVAPILFEPDDFLRTVDSKVDAELKEAKVSGGADWLFVGRVTPHKCQHQLIQALAVYRQLYDPNARLHLVGGLSSHRYWTALKDLVHALGLHDAVNITLGVSNEALGAYYANADVFVCLSEHEGFGVPVLEALYDDVPVVAFDSSAVGETLGSGGVLLPRKAPVTVAAAVHRVLADDVLRKSLCVAGRAQLAQFSLAATEDRWRQVIKQLVGKS